MIKKILKALNKGNNKTEQHLTLLHELQKIPFVEKPDEMPHYENFKKNFCNQADLLHLPTSRGGYKYLLVVVDNHTRKFDAEPMKHRSSSNTVYAFKKLYERNLIKEPKQLQVDAGVEFQGVCKEYFLKKGINYRVALTNRHRQQALAESRNHVLGSVIMAMLTLNELADKTKKKKLSTDWYKSPSEFRTLIKMINKEIKYKPKTKKEEEDYEDTNNESKKSVDILDTGTKVRVTLDYPIDTKGKRLYGKFRAGDIRWSNDIKTIKWIVLKPDEVPMYRVSGEKVLRTRQQLQVVD